MQGALHRADFRRHFASLIDELIHRMTRMMPEQMIRPAARLAFRVHIRSSEKERLHDEVLQLEFAGFDLFVNKLMTRVESPRVATHRDKTSFLLNCQDLLRIRERV